MQKSIRSAIRASTAPLLAGTLLLTAIALVPAAARAFEIIPSIGMTKSTESDAGDSEFSGGLALRAPLFPFLKVEGGITYRQDSYFDQNLKVRMWPVTASAWFTPFPTLYAGGGLGWYRTTYDFSAPLLQEDATSSKIGVHLGGGALVPIASNLGLDFNGRYIFMQQDGDIELPSTFNPDFWSASVGLSIQF